MIYITGDTHIPLDIKKLANTNFREQLDLSKNDYVIVCGDFGGVWYPWGTNAEQEWWLKWLELRNFTTLFVDGNHENHAMLKELPQVDMFGSKVGKVNNSVYHLKRGEIYEIEGKKIFTFGGADSIDKARRKTGISWWREELPSYAEIEYAFDNLDKHNWEVDIVLTHCVATTLLYEVKSYYYPDAATEFLENIYEKCSYKKWYFGHYHEDIHLDAKHRGVYNDIVKVQL